MRERKRERERDEKEREERAMQSDATRQQHFLKNDLLAREGWGGGRGRGMCGVRALSWQT